MAASRASPPEFFSTMPRAPIASARRRVWAVTEAQCRITSSGGSRGAGSGRGGALTPLPRGGAPAAGGPPAGGAGGVGGAPKNAWTPAAGGGGGIHDEDWTDLLGQ